MSALSIRWARIFAIVSLLHFSCSTTSSLTSLLAADPDLSGISSLLQRVGGIGSLLGSGNQPYTLLAPTNEALSALGNDAVQNLLKPDNENQLINLLKQQIIPGKVKADDLKAGTVMNEAGNVVNLGTTALGAPMKTKDGGLVYKVNQLLGK